MALAPQQIAVIGAGYVGLTTAACLAHLGHHVRCSDSDPTRIAQLEKGRSPILEHGLEELVREAIAARRLAFSVDNLWAVAKARYTFLCVPTPARPDGSSDMSYVEAVAAEIGPYLATDSVVVNKSTVPVGSSDVVSRTIARDDIAVVSNPEFLREGSAVADFLHPDRIVIGASDEETAVGFARLFTGIDAQVLFTSPATAETIKYASNAFLATKVSFMNALAAVCECVGADVRQVGIGVGLDRRIGSSFLRPGPGWGGSCLPKDTAALVRIAEENGYDFSLLKGVISVNEEQHDRVVQKAIRLAGGSLEARRACVLGLTFKARTDDLRSSPAIQVAARLAAAGAAVTAFDPTVARALDAHPQIEIARDPYAACEGASVVVLATEWDEFRWLDYDKVGNSMSHRAIVDARNLLDPSALRRLGFAYEGIGVV
jgi:UDPglucose 6-dehydrogenase